MSSTSQRYPLSTPDGISIPFDVIRPSGYLYVNTALTVSGHIAVPAGNEIISFSASEDCIITFGANASIPVSGTMLANAVYIPKDMRITVAPIADYFTVIAPLPDVAPLLEMLRDDRPHADAMLPRTGVSLEFERLLSSAFVKAPGYGTRSSTILTVSRGDTPASTCRFTFDEQTWLPGGKPGARCRYRFSSPSSTACSTISTRV